MIRLLVLISILLVVVAIITLYNGTSEIYMRDIDYFHRFTNNKGMDGLLDNNKLLVPKRGKSRVLIVTFDDRPNVGYIAKHNENLQRYADKWNYTYKFYSRCEYNVYWCKLHLVLDELESDQYDYVMWLDSDTFIKNFDIDLNDILNSYSSDIFVGSDNHAFMSIVNAGVFIIRNSDVGKQFLEDCIDTIDKRCIDNDNKLNGIWAASCYEQGLMNLLIDSKYSAFTTILPNNILYNSYKCQNNTFIMHLYGATSEERLQCFK